MSKITTLVALLWLSVLSMLSAQGSFTTTNGASVRISGGAYLKLHNTQWHNDGTFSAGAGAVEFSGNQPGGAYLGGFMPDIFRHLRINRSAGTVALLKNALVTGNMTFSNGLFNLNGFNVTLAQPGAVLTGENETSRVFSSSTGELQLVAALNAPAAVNPANIGAALTSAANLGTTVVRRGHLSFIGPCDGSIKRYFAFQPANNSGLNATLRLYYFDAELNDAPENDLILYRSDNGGASWIAVGFDSRNTTQNWVEKTGLSSLTMFTLADAGWLSIKTWYLDADNDNYYTGTGITQCASPGEGYRSAGLTGGGDCDDTNAAINPGAAEIPCNGVDENCNGIADDDPEPPAISVCPVIRTFTGCDLNAISGPVFSATEATSSYAEFSHTNNQGDAGDNCVIAGVTYQDVQTSTCPITVARTWTLSDGKATTSCVQTLQVNAPAVQLNCPNDAGEPACQSQTAIDAAFSDWLSAFGFMGGCSANGSFDGGTPSAPSACGGSVTVTYRVTSACAADAVCTKTFAVASSPVILECPANTTVSNCQTQTEVNNAFAAWLAEASLSGGCGANLSNNAGAAPPANGGSVTVEFRVQSACEPDVVCSRTFAVGLAGSVSVQCPSSIIRTISQDNSPEDCISMTNLIHPVPQNGCLPYNLSVAFANGVPTPGNLPAGGSVTPGGNTTYAFDAGQTVVTYQATDAYGGNTTQCSFTVTVQDDTKPTLACPASTSQMPNSGTCTFTISGTAYDPTGVGDNCGVAGVSNDFNNSSTLAGTLLPTGANLIEWTVTDVNGGTNTCRFTLTVTACVEISGTIFWKGDGVAGVHNVNVELSGEVSNTDATELNGDFDLVANTGDDFVITPSKNTGGMLNGVTAADATVIQRHLTGNELITDFYRLIAADCNRSNNISSLDAALIRQALLGNPSSLNILNATGAWRFVRTDYVPVLAGPYTLDHYALYHKRVLAGVSGTQPAQDFYGVKAGDVFEESNPGVDVADPTLKPDPDAKPLVWRVRDRLLKTGQTIELDFSVANFTDIAAYQYGMRFDPTVLQYQQASGMSTIVPLDEASNFGTWQVGKGELRTLWSVSEGKTMPGVQPMYRLRFRVLQGGKKLSEVLGLDPSILAALAYTSQLAQCEVQLVFTDYVQPGLNQPDVLAGDYFDLLQSRPNPFSERTTIGFILPIACDAQLRVLDINGRELWRVNKTYPAGYHEEVFRLEEIGSTGMLFYELTTPQGKQTRKMLAVRL